MASDFLRCVRRRGLHDMDFRTGLGEPVHISHRRRRSSAVVLPAPETVDGNRRPVAAVDETVAASVFHRLTCSFFLSMSRVELGSAGHEPGFVAGRSERLFDKSQPGAPNVQSASITFGLIALAICHLRQSKRRRRHNPNPIVSSESTACLHALLRMDDSRPGIHILVDLEKTALEIILNYCRGSRCLFLAVGLSGSAGGAR